MKRSITTFFAGTLVLLLGVGSASGESNVTVVYPDAERYPGLLCQPRGTAQTSDWGWIGNPKSEVLKVSCPVVRIYNDNHFDGFKAAHVLLRDENRTGDFKCELGFAYQDSSGNWSGGFSAWKSSSGYSSGVQMLALPVRTGSQAFSAHHILNCDIPGVDIGVSHIVSYFVQ